MPIRQLLPLIRQKAADDRAEKRRLKIQEIQTALQSGELTPEKRDSLQAELSSRGRNPSADFLIPRGSFEPLFDQLGFDETLRQGVRDGIYTFKQAQNFNKGLTGRKPQTIESVRVLFNGLTPDQKRNAISPEHMFTQLKVIDLFGKRAADEIFGIKEDDLSDILPKIGTVWRSLSDVKDPIIRDRIIQRYPDEKDRAALFGDPVTFNKLIESGKRSIREEGSLLFGEFFNKFEDKIVEWANHTLEDGPSKDYLDKYYNPTTKELDGGAVVESGRQALKLEKRLEREINLHPEERALIKRILPAILSKARTRGVTRQQVREGFEARLKDGTLGFSERIMEVILDMIDE